MWAAIQVAKRVGPGKKFVVILPDSVRNYMTKFLDDQWMKENGFTEKRWETNSVGDILRRLPQRKLITTGSADSVSDAVRRMKENGISQLPVLDDGRLIGIVTESDVLGRIVSGNATLSSKVAEVMFRRVHTINVRQDAGELLKMFAKDEVGLVLDDDEKLIGIVTKMDLVDHLTGTVSPALSERK
jgi:cystathionine beta-synthase